MALVLSNFKMCFVVSHIPCPLGSVYSVAEVLQEMLFAGKPARRKYLRVVFRRAKMLSAGKQ